MSTTNQTPSMKGIRYSDAQKKEIVDFVQQYNAANGRGGQSKAAEKFGVSQLTVATWLKAAGAPTTGKATKKAKAPEAAAKEAKAPQAAKRAKGKPGSRYTDAQKQELVDFVNQYNAENGRGGASKAVAKFGVSPLTVGTWLKNAGQPSKKAGKKAGKKAAKKAATKAAAGSSKSSGGIDAKLASLLDLSKEISKKQSELESLQSRFASLKASL